MVLFSEDMFDDIICQRNIFSSLSPCLPQCHQTSRARRWMPQWCSVVQWSCTARVTQSLHLPSPGAGMAARSSGSLVWQFQRMGVCSRYSQSQRLSNSFVNLCPRWQWFYKTWSTHFSVGVSKFLWFLRIKTFVLLLFTYLNKYPVYWLSCVSGLLPHLMICL